MDLGLRLAMLRVGINPDVPSEKTKQDEKEYFNSSISK